MNYEINREHIKNFAREYEVDSKSKWLKFCTS